MNKVKFHGIFPEEFESILNSTDPELVEQKKLINLVSQLTQQDHGKRPYAKDLLSQFDDQMFQEYLIENQNEFSKMVGSLFKNRFKFHSVNKDEFNLSNEGRG
jgi:hypothetical protein